MQLFSFDETSDAVNAKVADFGLAQFITTSGGVTERLETWQWMAPEAFANVVAGYDEKADVYSFGKHEGSQNERWDCSLVSCNK